MHLEDRELSEKHQHLPIRLYTQVKIGNKLIKRMVTLSINSIKTVSNQELRWNIDKALRELYREVETQCQKE